MFLANRHQPRFEPIHGRIRWLVIVCTLPVWILAGLIGYVAYERERGDLRDQAQQLAGGLLQDMQKDLAANEAVLHVLALSPEIDRADFAAFHRQAQEALRHTSGFTLVLTDPSGQQVVNLLRTYGTALPRHADPDLLQRTLASGRTTFSDVHLGGATNTPVVSMEVPVLRTGKPVYALALGLDARYLDVILRQQTVPTNWVVSILDSQGKVIARNREADKFVGRPSRSELLRDFQGLQQGFIDLQTQAGEATLAVLRRSAVSGWAVVIELPEQALLADLRREFGGYALLGSVLLGLGLWLAGAMGRRWITRPVQALIQPALAIGHGDAVAIPRLPLQEIDAVGQALQQVQQRLAEQNAQRERAEVEERRMRLAAQEADMALRVSEQRFRLAMEAGTTVAFTMDRELRYTWVHSCQVGFDDKALLGKTEFDLFTADTARVLTALYREVISSGAGLRRDVMVRSLAKPVDQHFDLIVEPMLGAGHEVCGIICAAIDISRRVAAEASMQRLAAEVLRSEQRLSRAQRIASLGSWELDLVAPYQLVWSDETYRIFGLQPQEFAASYEAFLDCVHPDDRATVDRAYTDSLRDGMDGYEVEHRIVRKSTGEIRAVHEKCAHVRDASGQMLRSVGMVQDVTERKKVEQALHAAKIEAERANLAKSRFLAAASHDLRQPLAALAMYVGSLKYSLTPQDGTLLRHMKDCVGSLSEMLTNLLDLSKLEAGVVQPEMTDFPVADAFASVVSVFSPEAREKGIYLRCVDTPLVARSDAVLFNRIVCNLVSNAVRYTDRGGVLIGCRRRQGRVWVEVWDSGIGFPEDRLDEIFDEFVQLREDERNRDKGSGLGLAIVAKTAALLGLQLRVRSWAGRGSMFAVELPLGGTLDRPGRVAAPTRPLRIGLVDDDAYVLQALDYSLRAAGNDVVPAFSREELMTRLDGAAPDIVISDYRLSGGETGAQVASSLREAFGAALPIIIMTGDTDARLAQQLLDEHVTVRHKPVDFDALQACIAAMTEVHHTV